jgi:hypothetical protein
MRKAQPHFELAQLVANPVDLSVNAQAIQGAAFRDDILSTQTDLTHFTFPRSRRETRR